MKSRKFIVWARVIFLLVEHAPGLLAAPRWVVGGGWWVVLWCCFSFFLLLLVGGGRWYKWVGWVVSVLVDASGEWVPAKRQSDRCHWCFPPAIPLVKQHSDMTYYILHNFEASSPTCVFKIGEVGFFRKDQICFFEGVLFPEKSISGKKAHLGNTCKIKEKTELVYLH